MHATNPGGIAPQTKRTDDHAWVIRAMLSLAQDGPCKVNLPPRWCRGGTPNFLKDSPFPGGWVPTPFLRTAGVDAWGSVNRWLAQLCEAGMIEHKKERYAPPTPALTFRLRGGGILMSSIEHDDNPSRVRAVDDRGVVAVVVLSVDRCLWNLHYAQNGEAAPVRVVSIPLDDAGLATEAVDFIRLTEEGAPWAEQLLNCKPDDDATTGADGQEQKERRESGWWLNGALNALRLHSEWSSNKVAEHIGVNPGTLSRSPEYKRMLAASKSRDLKPGKKVIDKDSGLKDIEATTYDPKPNFRF